MPGNEHNGPVVVGIDGSDSAIRAARWAAEQAERRGVALRLVHAFELPFRFPTGIVEQDSIRDILREQTGRWLVNARAAVVEVMPYLPLEVVTVDGPAVETLRSESAAASLVVLGSRGLGGFTGLLIGSTAVALAGRAHCPMVVVRGTDDADRDGPVVVGVDGTSTGEAAIAFAFDEASARGVELIAVHSWSEPVIQNSFAAGALAVDYRLLAEEATVLLAERLAGWQEKYPDVHVTGEIVHDNPARALLDGAATAQLVVVGSRGRGGFRGLVLGSTSQHLLHHAPCPVAVVRTDRSA